MAVKSTDYSFRRSGFNSQHTHTGAANSNSRDPASSSGLQGIEHTWCRAGKMAAPRAVGDRSVRVPELWFTL